MLLFGEVISIVQQKDIVFCVPLLVLCFLTKLKNSSQHLVFAKRRKSVWAFSRGICTKFPVPVLIVLVRIVHFNHK